MADSKKKSSSKPKPKKVSRLAGYKKGDKKYGRIFDGKGWVYPRKK